MAGFQLLLRYCECNISKLLGIVLGPASTVNCDETTGGVCGSGLLESCRMGFAAIPFDFNSEVLDKEYLAEVGNLRRISMNNAGMKIKIGLLLVLQFWWFCRKVRQRAGKTF